MLGSVVIKYEYDLDQVTLSYINTDSLGLGDPSGATLLAFVEIESRAASVPGDVAATDDRRDMDGPARFISEKDSPVGSSSMANQRSRVYSRT